MRYDTSCFFRTEVRGERLPNGDYADPAVTEVKKDCSVYSLEKEEQGAICIHLPLAYTEPYDRIRIGDKLYEAIYTAASGIRMIIHAKEVL